MSIDVVPRPARSGPPVERGRRAWDGPILAETGVAAALAVAAWLPFLDVPLSPDEAGFLLLAQHWDPGSSLYGNYWVDRPPLLIWLFSLAGQLGYVGHASAGLTAPIVKLLGAGASGVAVLLTGVLGYVVAPAQRWARRSAVVAALALLSSPLLGMPETDGEVLAVPFVLLGVACLVAATRQGWGRRAALLTGAAGASAMCSALIKQNVVDVFVFAAILFVVSGRGLPRLWARVGVFAAASALVLVVTMSAAAARGTASATLWDAIVVFRFQAAAVIRASASDATPGRMAHLAFASAASGAVTLLVVAAGAALQTWREHRRPPTVDVPGARGMSDSPLIWSALGMVLWELSGVALGGSYWLHYLTGVVPGVVLLVAIVRPSPRWLRLLTLCVRYVVVSSAVVWLHHAVTPVSVSDDARVIAYLRGHSERSDGVVVAFGHPDIVAGSGLSSPYEYLWSLPVRVRDPHLQELSETMTGANAPRWVIVAGDSLGSWGLDAVATQRVLGQNYVELVTYGDWHVWRHSQEGNGP